MQEMEVESVATVLFMVLILFFSLDFNKIYGSGFHDLARHPFARFLMGLCVVGLANENPKLAMLAFILVFFWIADVNLLSSFSL